MNRRQRLLSTIKGEKTDRTPVCFYEINGYDEDVENTDPFNIFNDASWKELIELARDHSDRIVMRGVPFVKDKDPIKELTKTTEYFDDNGSLHIISEIEIKERKLRQHTRRDPDIDTLWTLEHFLKDEEDIKAYLDLPHDDEIGEPNFSRFLKAEEDIGDTGIVMLDTGDALCEVAGLFSMEDYTIFAMTEPELFSKLMDISHSKYKKRIEIVSKQLPDRLWRIYGPEYATPPYLPPYLYERYVVNYDGELVREIKKNGGMVRIHQHGNSKAVLPMTLSMGCDGLDPVEPTPQGDITLKEARSICGEDFTLFGNLEVSDIEMCPPEVIEQKVEIALREGPNSNGSRFVLMPSASPYGRKLSKTALDNYKRIVEIIER